MHFEAKTASHGDDRKLQGSDEKRLAMRSQAMRLVRLPPDAIAPGATSAPLPRWFGCWQQRVPRSGCGCAHNSNGATHPNRRESPNVNRSPSHDNACDEGNRKIEDNGLKNRARARFHPPAGKRGDRVARCLKAQDCTSIPKATSTTTPLVKSFAGNSKSQQLPRPGCDAFHDNSNCRHSPTPKAK